MLRCVWGWFHKTSEEPDEPVRPEEDLSGAIELIKRWEGFRADAYQDPVGIWTIGYGTIRYPDGGRVTAVDVVTKAEAEGYLLGHVMESIVGPMRGLLDVPVTVNQYNALVSFAYNVGMGAFERSTMRRYINKGRPSEAAKEFNRWTKAGGKKLQGLVRRRAAERKLFETHSDTLMDI
jgi:lysozyme